MKYCTRMLILAWIMASLTAPCQAIAADADSRSPEPCGSWQAMKERFLRERLAVLHRELKLAAVQEADWKSWSDKAILLQKQNKPDLAALKKLPATDRLEAWVEYGQERQKLMEALLIETRAYYSTLSMEQRKTFDELMPIGERAPRSRYDWLCQPRRP